MSNNNVENNFILRERETKNSFGVIIENFSKAMER